MRGKAIWCTLFEYKHRITPAYAGKRLCKLYKNIVCKDHPRLCGEKQSGAKAAWNERGITPAYAGKRHLPNYPQVDSQDHPRLCGEKLWKRVVSTTPTGSPPPMRGKALPVTFLSVMFGITPAYAGKRFSRPRRGSEM